MREITVSLSDLQRILVAMFNLDVEARQHRASINHAMIENQPARARYLELLQKEKQPAIDATLPRYQRLNDALAGADDTAIRVELERFARRAMS